MARPWNHGSINKRVREKTLEVPCSTSTINFNMGLIVRYGKGVRGNLGTPVLAFLAQAPFLLGWLSPFFGYFAGNFPVFLASSPFRTPISCLFPSSVLFQSSNKVVSYQNKAMTTRTGIWARKHSMFHIFTLKIYLRLEAWQARWISTVGQVLRVYARTF